MGNFVHKLLISMDNPCGDSFNTLRPTFSNSFHLMKIVFWFTMLLTLVSEGPKDSFSTLVLGIVWCQVMKTRNNNDQVHWRIDASVCFINLTSTSHDDVDLGQNWFRIDGTKPVPATISIIIDEVLLHPSECHNIAHEFVIITDTPSRNNFNSLRLNDIIDLGQPWFRKWFVVNKHQAITGTNIDLPLMRLSITDKHV